MYICFFHFVKIGLEIIAMHKDFFDEDENEVIAVSIPTGPQVLNIGENGEQKNHL